MHVSAGEEVWAETDGCSSIGKQALGGGLADDVEFMWNEPDVF